MWFTAGDSFIYLIPFDALEEGKPCGQKAL